MRALFGIRQDGAVQGSGDDIFFGMLSGRETVTGGSGQDAFLFIVGGHDFALTVTGCSSTIRKKRKALSANEALPFAFFHLSFIPESGVSTRGDAEAAVSQTVVGDDVVVTVVTPKVYGTITFEGAADLMRESHRDTVWAQAAIAA
jgi:hypothetical protein